MRHRSIAIVKDEQGATAIIIALLITVFVGLLAYVVDIGYSYEMRRQLQSAADAAALAGMAEKINGAGDDEVLDIAKVYAVANDTIGQPDDLTLLTGLPHTEITEDYVQVGVEKTAEHAFATIFGYTDTLIRAQARAKRVYVTGAKGLIPWGVATIKADDMEATVGGATSDLSYDSNADEWSGSLVVPAGTSSDGYPIDLTIENSQGFPLTFAGVGAVVVHPAGDAVSDVYLSDNVLAPGQSTYLYVAATAAPSAGVGRDSYSEAAFTLVGAGLYRTSIGAPTPTEAFQTYAIDIGVGNESYDDQARLIVRTTNSPIDTVDFGTLHFAAGGGGTPISVEMREFQYGEVYNLKVVSNPEAGNFNALDFRYIYHPPDYATNHGENSSASDYYDNLSGFYDGSVHIGDIITSKTGNLSGPKTTGALDTRTAGCSLDFSGWEAAGRPGGCGKLVTVPIIEHIERVTGQTDVMVYAIAEFFLEGYQKIGNDKVNISGRFIRYAKVGTYSDTPPDSGLYMETVRLERPDY